MRNVTKLLLIGTAVAGGTAQAGIANNFTTGTTTDVVLFVSNSADASNFYERDLGFTMDQLLSASNSLGANDSAVTAGVNLNIAADGALGSYLSSHTTGITTFSLLGGSAPDNSSAGPGQARYVLTTAYQNINNGTSGNHPSNNNLLGIHDNLLVFFDEVSTAMGASTTAVTPTGFGDTTSSVGSVAPSYFQGTTNGQTVGQTAQLYAMVSNSNGLNLSSPANVLRFGTLAMDTLGNLTYTAASTGAVPLPAAVWLLGSGLLGLAGVGRRKAA